jgi:hypothetical protein
MRLFVTSLSRGIRRWVSCRAEAERSRRSAIPGRLVLPRSLGRIGWPRWEG